MHKGKFTVYWFQVHNTPLIFYTPNSPDLTSIKSISKILKYILQHLGHLLQAGNAPHFAIQNACDDLPIKAIKYPVV